MRFVRGDTRDHIISCKNDHGASYRRYGVLHWWCRLKINVLRDFRHRSIFDFCNIIGHFRKSAFVVARSALLPATDIVSPASHVRKVPTTEVGSSVTLL